VNAGPPSSPALAERIADPLLRVLLGMVAANVFLAILTLLAAHARDQFEVGDNAGVWMTLAKEAGDGHLYRPLFDGQFYGGTRYMPIPILSYALVEKVSGSLLTAGKLLSYLFAFAVVAVLVLILRRRRCSTLASLALVSVIFVTPVGLLAAAGIHFDTPALAFQLAALLVIGRWESSTRAAGAAGLLCALALLSKLNAVWAPIAIGIWLLVRHRRQLAVFAGAFAGSLAAGVAVFELASHGRFAKNIWTLGFAGYHGSVGESGSGATLSAGADRLLSYAHTQGDAVFWLFPIALLAVGVAAWRRRLTVFDVAFLVIVPILFLLYRDEGADYNHLIDPAALTVVAMGGLWGSSRPRLPEFTWLRAGIALALTASVANFFHPVLYAETEAAAKQLAHKIPDPYPRATPLAAEIGPSDRLLSEDPYIAITLGKKPVIADQFMYLRLIRSHPSWPAALARRVEAREFDEVVLEAPIFYGLKIGHFGRDVNEAIRRNYRLVKVERTVGRGYYYWLYRPRPAT
jgi:hypothetical protein